MIEVGGRPILRHIMEINAQQGLKEFVILLGYKATSSSDPSPNMRASPEHRSQDGHNGAAGIR
jgi:glucose-1-phosphate cytidylyltransferase